MERYSGRVSQSNYRNSEIYSESDDDYVDVSSSTNKEKAVETVSDNTDNEEELSSTEKKTSKKVKINAKKIDNPDEECFKNLTYEQVQINLRFLADLKEGEKVMITDGRFMTVDQRYAQSVRRYLTSDSRTRTLNFISHVITCTKNYCCSAVDSISKNQRRQINLEKLINIQSLLRNAKTGLGRLSATYSDDKLNLATIETFKSEIETFCDQDLKRAIDADKTK